MHDDGDERRVVMRTVTASCMTQIMKPDPSSAQTPSETLRRSFDARPDVADQSHASKNSTPSFLVSV
jgi:hypothetical protein